MKRGEKDLDGGRGRGSDEQRGWVFPGGPKQLKQTFATLCFLSLNVHHDKRGSSELESKVSRKCPVGKELGVWQKCICTFDFRFGAAGVG